MILRILLISSIFLSLVSCKEGLGIKIYISKPELGGIYREQEKELILYPDTTNYFCVNENDFKKLIEAYKACEDLKANDSN